MSEQFLKSISSDTGRFTIVKDPVRVQSQIGRGKTGSPSGNPMPAEKAEPNLEQLTRQLNLASRSIGRDLRFEVDLESGRSIIQVLDRETGEIIRQIPAEKVVASLNGGAAASITLYDELV